MKHVIVDLAPKRNIRTRRQFRNHTGHTTEETRNCCIHPDREGNFPVFGPKGHNHYCLSCAMKQDDLVQDRFISRTHLRRSERGNYE